MHLSKPCTALLTPCCCLIPSSTLTRVSQQRQSQNAKPSNTPSLHTDNLCHRPSTWLQTRYYARPTYDSGAETIPWPTKSLHVTPYEIFNCKKGAPYSKQT